VSSLPLSLTTTLRLPHSIISRSSSCVIRTPESEVSATTARHSRVSGQPEKLFPLHRAEELTVRRRGGRKPAIGTTTPMLVPIMPEERWSPDFVSD
jgi:hypothetical protein